MVDINDRAALWQRLLDMKYFDAHSRKQLKAEQKYFFEGEATYEYNKYRGEDASIIDYKDALFMHPVQTPERWREWQANVGYATGGTYEQDILNTLICRDYQYLGCTPEDQVALLVFLGIGDVYDPAWPINLKTAVESWVRDVHSWLRSDKDSSMGCSYDSYKLERNKFVLLKKLFYSMLGHVPGDVFLNEIPTCSEDPESTVWREQDKAYIQYWIRDFLLLLATYEIPEALECDPQARLDFVAEMQADLEEGAAPAQLQALWAEAKKPGFLVDLDDDDDDDDDEDSDDSEE